MTPADPPIRCASLTNTAHNANALPLWHIAPGKFSVHQALVPALPVCALTQRVLHLRQIKAKALLLFE